MKSFSEYPQKNRIAIAVGFALIAIGACGLAYEYYSVGWWRRLVDDAHLVVVAAFPIALIVLAACLASTWGRKTLDSVLHSKVKRPIYASRTDRRIAGVCGGFAASRQVNSGFVRLVVLLLFVAFPLTVIVLYSIAAIVIEPE